MAELLVLFRFLSGTELRMNRATSWVSIHQEAAGSTLLGRFLFVTILPSTPDSTRQVLKAARVSYVEGYPSRAAVAVMGDDIVLVHDDGTLRIVAPWAPDFDLVLGIARNGILLHASGSYFFVDHQARVHSLGELKLSGPEIVSALSADGDPAELVRRANSLLILGRVADWLSGEKRPLSGDVEALLQEIISSAKAGELDSINRGLYDATLWEDTERAILRFLGHRKECNAFLEARRFE